MNHAFGVKDLSISELFADQAEIGIHKKAFLRQREGAKSTGNCQFVKGGGLGLCPSERNSGRLESEKLASH
ncbi:MAG: hypothetical protein QM778_09800 [Myxococcales bacterium]